MTSNRPRIIVGCDGSPESATALDWAAHHAQLTGGNVCIVSGWDWPTYQGVPITYDGWDPPESCNTLVERLRATIDLPDDRVRVEVARGKPAALLVDRATEADLLVVGSHGLGALSRLVLGSVSGYCTTHAPCPVAVVRADSEGNRRGIVVGVDESDTARSALRWAMGYAELARQPLTVVYVAEAPPPPLPGHYPVSVTHPRAAVHRQIRHWLDDLVAKEEADRGSHPASGVKVRVVDGNPAHVMVQQSARSSLTVCGRRGAGGFRRLRLGSVASALAHHGHSTLVVTPQD